MDILRIAAFSDGDTGGNPAGVLIADALPSAAQMQQIAAQVGYSETAFAAPQGAGWRVRYFAPESEVPFCGHATIALGAALALKQGDGVFALTLNHAEITVHLHTAKPRQNRWFVMRSRCLATKQIRLIRASRQRWRTAALITWCYVLIVAPHLPLCAIN
jgi:PhzF family phenazine biosynthesis protein